MPLPHRSRLSKRQSMSFVRRQRDRTTWKVGLVFVVILAWLFVFSRLSGLGMFSISHVEVYGADPDITAQLRNAALSELYGSYFRLFARSDTFIYPRRDIAETVKAASVRVDTVDVRRAGLHGLAITVTEKVPVAIVCAGLPDFSADPSGGSASTTPVADDSGCYYADDSGFIFAKAPSFSSQIYRRYYEPDLADMASSSGPIGAYATSTEEFTALQSFFTGVHDNGIHALGILLKDGGEYELYAENPSAAALSAADAHSNIAVIYFNDAGSLATELSSLVSFWAKEASKARASGTSLHFDSIDVRYGSNVFYRLQK
jgi:hypothetical protein